MPHNPFFRSSILPVVATTIAALLLPGTARAQQEAASMALPSGSCGQSLGLTSIFALPLDQVAPVNPVLRMARHEPRFIEFQLAAPGTVRFETSYPGGESADPYLVLFDTAGNVIDYNDDGAGDLNALLDLTLDAGLYCAQVRMLGGPPQGPVDVTLDIRVNGSGDAGAGDAQIGAVFAGDPGLPCGDPARTIVAGRLAPGFGSLGFDGVVPASSSQDWVIALQETMSLRIEASDPKLDTVLTLRDAARNVVAENDDGPGMGTDSLIVETLSAGEYCVSIAGFAGVGGTARLDLIEAGSPEGGSGIGGGQGGGGLPGQIEGGSPEGGSGGGMSFAVGAPCGDPARTLLLGRVARGFGGVTASGVVPNDGQQDWILSLADPLELRLDASSRSFDTVLSVYDTGGALVDENDDSPEGGTDSQITRSFAPGDYCLTVRGFGGSGGAMDLSAAEVGSSGGGGTGGGAGGGFGGGGMGGVFAAGQPCGDPALTEEVGVLQAGFLQTFRQGDVPFDSARHYAADLRERLDMTVTATSGQFDTVLSVHDAGGVLLAENDDGPDMGTDSSLTAAFGPGPVCFSVRGFGGSGGAFELAIYEDDTPQGGGGGLGGGLGADVGGGSVDSVLPVGPGPCGDPAQTASIGTLGDGFGRLALALQVPAEGRSNVQFDLAAGGTLRIETTETNFDTILELHGPGGLVEENDDSPEGGTDSLITVALEADSYCASVRGFAGAGGQLSLVLSDPGSDGVPGGGGAGSGGASLEMPLPASGVEMTDLGALGASGLSQNEYSAAGPTWVVFDLPAPGLVEVQAINLAGGFVLALFDADTGVSMAEAPGWGGMDPAMIAADLPAGRFAVGLAPGNAADPGLRRIEIRPGG